MRIPAPRAVQRSMDLRSSALGVLRILAQFAQ